MISPEIDVSGVFSPTFLVQPDWFRAARWRRSGEQSAVSDTLSEHGQLRDDWCSGLNSASHRAEEESVERYAYVVLGRGKDGHTMVGVSS
jgi:hypothetical protein